MAPPIPARRLAIRLGLATVAGLFCLAIPGRADAQFGFGGFGGGFGYGFGLNYRPMSVESVYGRASMEGQHAYNTRQESLKAPFTPRDTSFMERNSVESRSSLESRVASERRRSQAQATQVAQAATASPSAPILPLASFFDSYDKLVWPAEAPKTGDLAALRVSSDAATTSVYQQVKAQGYAPVGLVTDARDKLLDYGRPALQQIRATSTARIADSFHLFMLSLYESLAQASKPIAATARNTPAPAPPNRP